MSITKQTFDKPYTLPLGDAMTRYLTVQDGKVVIADTLAELLSAYPILAMKPDAEVLSQFLQHSIVPYPHTIYPHVWALGVGDTATFQTAVTAPHLANAMPFLPENTLPNTRPASTATLKDLLTKSVERKLPARAPAAIMLSSGKDSVGITIALQAAGRTANLTAMTYAEEGSPNSEAELAADIARKAGIKHMVVPLPTDQPSVREAMTTFFEQSAQPVSDPVAPAYIMALHRAGVKDQHLIDGTGNDLYMGILPPKKQKWYRYGPGEWNLADSIQPFLPFHHPFNKFLRPPSDGPILGRLALRHAETRQFIDSIQTNPYWRAMGNNPRLKGSYQRFFQHMRSYYYDGAHTTRVREEVAHAGNNTLVLPYMDPGLHEYYRQLPVSARYDEEGGRNKLLLRQLLLEELDYDATKVGKRIFSFDQAKFLLTHRSFVESEINDCTLWNDNISTFVMNLYDQLPTIPGVRYGLMQLFLLAGWYNHSRFLNKA